ncbi:type II/IV secretion system ATPase subunit [Methanolobus psychrotolerans]|uniref:type II/IV secretion system ATPase subunit n=1 Tax=Methanolobus psychrotolerans TaxID=1874706 RepID=UPI001F5C56A9|nr:type II/IV secretion system ATPase subunit [Methanolobus psychrotolerans]
MIFEKTETYPTLKNDTIDIAQYDQIQLVLSERRPVDILPENKGKVKRVFNKFLGSLSSLAGKQKEDNKGCTYKLRISKKSRGIIIDCKECDHGSCFENEHCRKSIFHILQKETVAERLTLSKLYERDYEGKAMEMIYLMASLKDKLVPYKTSKFVLETCDNSAQCSKEYTEVMKLIIETSETDPLKACYIIDKLIEYKVTRDPRSETRPECVLCREKSTHILREINSISKKITNCIDMQISGEYQGEYGIEYEKYLRSYVRPPFSTSRIYTEPPDNTIFQECYDIRFQDERPLPVSIYQLTDRPEKMYMITPTEYSLEERELNLIEKVRKKMIVHRPANLQFADPVNSREYFHRLSKQLLLEEKEFDDILSDPAKVKLCCDLLTKYTTGLGILEDLLSDERVNDVYVNAPADLNPVHVVLDGEECVTNIYLSQEDMESMVSRLRSISGRPFGEATPVLEMFLKEYGVRVSVIGDPLSAKGIAYAFRKHAKDPWTLPKLINNGSLSSLTAGLLSFIMDGQASVLVAGGVGAGKTSLMCALLLEMPQKYRMITIEDTPEIPVEEFQEMGWKVQGLNSQSAIMKYGIEIEPSVALRASLRLGSSSLIMGEVRGPEVAVLYEAMQVGAAGNSVIGTIHGSSTDAVYERIVNTLRVPSASFKATDAVIVCANTRIAGGMKMKRRIMQVAEVNEKWEENPEKVFSDILTYDASNDCLQPSDIMDRGQSVLIGKIADKWGISMDEASRNIRMRAKVKGKIADYGKENHCLLEARNVAIANNMFWLLMDREISESKETNYQIIYDRWLNWFNGFAGKKEEEGASCVFSMGDEIQKTIGQPEQYICTGDQAV